MNLSEDGVLVMQLEQRRLLIRVRNIDDLKKYINFLLLKINLRYTQLCFSNFIFES